MIEFTLNETFGALTTLAATFATGVIATMKRQLNRLELQIDQIEDRVDNLERAAGFDTRHYHRRKDKDKRDKPGDPPRSKWRYAALLSAFVLLLTLAWLCTGCTGLAKTVKALGSDTNAVIVKIHSPWGSAEVYRNAKP